MEIEPRRVRGGWYRVAGSLTFVAEPGSEPLPSHADVQAAAERVNAAFARAVPEPAPAEAENARAGLVDGPVWGSQLVRTSQGWAGVLRNVARVDDAVAWLTRWTEEIPAEFSTVHSGIKHTRPFQGRGVVPVGTMGVLALTPMPRREKFWSWAVEPAVTVEIAQHAVTALHRPGARTVLELQGTLGQVEVVGQDHALALAQNACLGHLPCLWATEPNWRERTVNFGLQGLLVLGSLDVSQTWQERVEFVSQILTWAPERSSYGAVVRRHGPPMPETALDHMPLGRASHGATGLAHLLPDYVPDAAAVQLLTRSHLDKATDLSAWTTRQVAADRYLVSARSLDDWFGTEAGPRLEAGSACTCEVHTQARNDFGEMILTAQVLEANPVPRR